MTRETRSKTAPKFLTFFLPFRGQRGGQHEAKFRLKLLAGTGNDGIVTENQAKEMLKNAKGFKYQDGEYEFGWFKP